MSTRLRMTAWPGQLPLPHVPVRETRFERTSDGWPWIVQSGAATPVELPVDFYLTEPFGTDLDNRDALTAFVAAWGSPVDPQDRDLPNPGLEPLVKPDRYDAATELKAHRGLNSYKRDLVGTWEVRARLKYLRAMALTAMAIKSGEPISGLWQDEDESASEDIAVHRFNLFLNAALGQLSPRVEIGDRVPHQTASVYTVAAVQIYNDLLAEGVVYRTCANERCGRPFTRQRGRAAYGEYRTKGVKFCSKSCALAQTQRERRRRLKAEREAHSD